MPRRNLLMILGIMIVSLVCYRQADQSLFARHLSRVFKAINVVALDPIDPQSLFDGAMEGIVGKLDQYSGYISAKDTAQFEADLDQEFGGIGVMIRLEPESDEPGAPKVLTVVNPPLFGTPAHKAGIHVRDRIVAIDDVPTSGMTMNDVIHSMRGKVGMPVKLLVLHEDTNETEPVEHSIIRSIINVPSVLGDHPRDDGTWKMALDAHPRIGIIRIVNFGEKTAGELAEALDRADREGVEALILDVRDNPGGLLDAAVECCDMFLPAEKDIVLVKGRNQHVQSRHGSTGLGRYLDIPIVVLVNHYSASASEIVAACLQDHGRAVVVGDRTWGKGTVQHVIRIQSGKALLKITAATYWRPSGKNIHRKKETTDQEEWGVKPNENFEIRLTELESARLRRARSERDVVGRTPEPIRDDPGHPPEPVTEDLDDPYLERAIEYLEKS